MHCEYMTDILFKAIDEVIDSGVLSGRRVVMFGLNAPAFICKQYLESKGTDIYAFVDNSPYAVDQFNDPNTVPTFHHMIGNRRLKAYKPDELPEEYHDEYVFLLYSKYEQEMLDQLALLGYEQGKQAFVLGGFWKTEEIKRAYVPDGAGRLMTAEEEKECQLAGLRYIHRLCEENNLKYYLHYGSLLGAVRHKGYIPWDDDLDILMMNEDMLKLMDIIKADNGRYEVFYAGTDDPVRHFIARLVDRETLYHQWDIPLETFGGMMALDIFPMAGMPGGEKESLDFYNGVMKYARDYDDLTVEYPNPSEEILAKKTECKKQVLDSMLKYSAWDSEFIFTIPTRPGRPLIFRREWWDEQIPMEFEGEYFMGPKGYDAILSTHYGDYMTPPPDNYKVSIHRTTTYWKQ